MKFSCAVTLAARRSGLAALMALSLSAGAQPVIPFSADPDPAATANSFLRSNHKSLGDGKAPWSLFDNSGSDADSNVLPDGPPAAYPNANDLRWQKMLQDRKNWALMTPEQVLQVPTPESIMGLTDPLEDPKLSPEERFMQRQDRQSQLAATNGWRYAQGGYSRDRDPNQGPLQNLDDRSLFENVPGRPGSGSFSSGPAKTRSPFASQHPETPADRNRKLNATWAGPFAAPEPLPKSTPAQLAGMEAFRALMVPPVRGKTPAGAGFSLPNVAAPDPNLQVLPVFSPFGRSCPPVVDGTTRIAPLAGVTGPPPVPAQKPSLVEPPPWLSPSLQNPTMPQRQF